MKKALKLSLGAIVLSNLLILPSALATSSNTQESIHFVAPPATFNPLNAINDELKKYGFPEKPNDPKELSVWKDHMSHAKHFIPPVLKTVVGTTHKTHVKSTSDTYTPNWSGWVATPNSGFSFAKIAGDFYATDISSSTVDSHVSSWVGLGGLNNSKLIQAGVEGVATTHWLSSTTTAYYVWTEMLPDQPYEQQISSFPINSGDHLYVHIVYGTHQDSSGNTIGDATFYIENLTQNNYTYYATSTLNATNDYYGGTAEWIDERPTVNGSYSNLAKFGTDTWTNLYAGTPSVSASLGSWANYPLNMRNPNNYNDLLAGPGSYNSASNLFVNYWYNYN
ncbi:hypothetical protein LSG31_07150 [Fodinisporobacter ferrooxydans]|uniref:Peptidase A4 family protein n=1 Tax=Fodinisporobacter ferrooxydans TaxID=2901836 RepID=A0ABY4CND9_9BACL|nr:hypothetical protein LSG31_07150 [Alicyclobacillaceae bacterium MYW30-H2]